MYETIQGPRVMKSKSFRSNVFPETSIGNAGPGLTFVFPDAFASQKAYLAMPGTRMGISFKAFHAEPGF
jgi:hypothetical protein